MRALGATIASSVVAMFAAASVAYAEGQIADIRFGKQPDADRVVLDMGVDPVDATQISTADRFVLELGASKPQLALEKEDRLADLKIFLEDSPLGTRLIVEKRNRPVQVFRIVAAPGSGKGDRLVLDVGRAGGSLTFPKDAARVPEGRATVAEPTPSPTPPRAPEPVVKTPDPEPVAEPVKPPPPVREEKRQETDLLDGMARAPQRETPASRPREPEVGAAPTAPAPLPPREVEPSKPLPVEPDAPADDGEKGEDVWVLVRAIDIQGVNGESPSIQDLNELKLAVSPVRGGFVAPRDNRPVQRLPLRALVGDDRNGRRLSGSVLQLIVETIAAEYTRNEKLGTRVDIRRADLEGLMQGGDGRLVIRVREMPARAAGSAEN